MSLVAEIAERGLPIPSAAANARLLLAAKHDDAARNELVSRNLPLCVKFAKNWTGNGLDLDELVSEASIGMMRAVESYDPAKGAWTTHAAYAIQGAIRRAITSQSRLVRIPDNLDPRIRGAAYTPSDDVTRALSLTWLDAAGVGEDGAVHYDVPDLEAGYERTEAEAAVDQLLGVLEPRDRELIERVFAIGRPKQSMGDIAITEGVTRAAISARCKRILDGLAEGRAPVKAKASIPASRSIPRRSGLKPALSDTARRELLSRYEQGGTTYKELAAEFGVSKQQVGRLVRGDAYATGRERLAA